MEAQTSEPTASPVEQIKTLLAAQADDVQSGKAQSAEDRPEAQADTPGEHDSGSSTVDLPESDEDASLQDVAALDAQESDAGDDAPAPVTMAEIAERLEVDAADLYEMEVKIKGRDPISLGELKDQYQEYGPVTEAREKVEKQTDKYERDLLATRRQIDAMRSVAQTPQEQAMIQRMMDAASVYQEGWQKDQEKLVLEAVPDWQDGDTRTKDKESIVALGQKYGFSQAEIEYTQDARTLRMLRDHARAVSRLDDMQAESKIRRKAPGAPGRQNTRKVTQRKLADKLRAAKASPHIHDKVGVIQDMINRK